MGNNISAGLEYLSSEDVNEHSVEFDAAKSLIRKNPMALESLPIEIKDDFDLVMKAVKINGDALRHASERLRDNKKIVEAAIAQCGRSLSHASLRLKSDKKTCLKAVQQDGDAIRFVTTLTLQNDPDLILYAMNIPHYIQYNFSKFDRSLYDIPEIVLLAVKHNADNFQVGGKVPRSNFEIAKIAVQKKGTLLEFVEGELKYNKELVLLACENDPKAFKIVQNRMNDDKDVAMIVIRQKAKYITRLSQRLKNDRDIVFLALGHNGLLLNSLSFDLKNDEEVVMMAVTENGESIAHASRRLRSHKDIALLSLEGMAMISPVVINSLVSDLLLDKDFFIKAIALTKSIFEHIPLPFLKDKEFVMKLVEIRPSIILEIPYPLNADCDVLAIAERKKIKSVRIGGGNQYKDKIEILVLAKNDGRVLEKASHKLRADKDVVRVCVMNDGSTLRFASKRLQNDDEIVMIAVNQSYSSLRYASERIKKSQRLIKGVVKKYGYSLQYVHDDLKDDIDVVRIAVHSNANAIKYASERLQKLYRENVSEFEYRESELFPEGSEEMEDESSKLDPSKIGKNRLCDDLTLQMKVARLHGTTIFKYVPFEKTSRDVLVEALKSKIRSKGDKSKFDYELSETDDAHEIDGKKLCITLDMVSWVDFEVTRELVKLFVQCRGSELKNVNNPEFRDSYDIALAAVKEDGKSIQYLSDRLKDDKHLGMIAVGNDSEGKAISFLSKRLSYDLDIICEALKKNTCYNNYNCERPPEDTIVPTRKFGVDEKKIVLDRIVPICNDPLRHLCDELKNDTEIILETLRRRRWGIECFWSVPDPLLKDREFLKNAIRVNWWVLKILKERGVELDEELVFWGVQQNGRALQFVPEDDMMFYRYTFVRRCVVEDGSCLRCLPYMFRGFIPIVTEAVKRDGLALEYASDSCKNNLDLVKIALEDDDSAFLFASHDVKIQLRDQVLKSVLKRPNLVNLYIDVEENGSIMSAVLFDRKIVEFCVSKLGRILGVVSSEFQDDEDVVFKAVKADPRAIKFASERIRDGNEEIMKYCIQRCGEVLLECGEKFRNDKEMVRLALENHENVNRVMIDAVNQHFTDPKYLIGRSLRSDKSFILECIEKYGSHAFSFSSSSIRRDREFILRCVEVCGAVLERVDLIFKEDIEIVKIAVKNDHNAIRYAVGSVFGDEEFMRKYVIEQNGSLLEHASQEIKENKEIVLLAVKNDGLALEHAGDDLRRDKEVIMAAFHQNWESFRFILGIKYFSSSMSSQKQKQEQEQNEEGVKELFLEYVYPEIFKKVVENEGKITIWEEYNTRKNRTPQQKKSEGKIRSTYHLFGVSLGIIMNKKNTNNNNNEEEEGEGEEGEEDDIIRRNCGVMKRMMERSFSGNMLEKGRKIVTFDDGDKELVDEKKKNTVFSKVIIAASKDGEDDRQLHLRSQLKKIRVRLGDICETYHDNNHIGDRKKQRMNIVIYLSSDMNIISKDGGSTLMEQQQQQQLKEILRFFRRFLHLHLSHLEGISVVVILDFYNLELYCDSQSSGKEQQQEEEEVEGEESSDNDDDDDNEKPQQTQEKEVEETMLLLRNDSIVNRMIRDQDSFGKLNGLDYFVFLRTKNQKNNNNNNKPEEDKNDILLNLLEKSMMDEENGAYLAGSPEDIIRNLESLKSQLESDNGSIVQFRRSVTWERKKMEDELLEKKRVN